MTRRLTIIVACLLALTACRLDVSVSVQMEPDGTGLVTMVAVADAELIAQVPELVDDLRLDDAIAQGWAIDGPVSDEGGGVTITLTHEFSSKDELANVLNSIGPPLTEMMAARTIEDEQTTNAVDGTLVLADGFNTFADADLIQAVGGLPFAEQIGSTALAPSDAMSFKFSVSLPGEVISSETGTEVDGGWIEWTAPLDGTSVDLYTATVQRPAGSGGAWAGPLSKVALVALVVWVIVAMVFIAVVVMARRKKRQRRERALRGLR